MFKRFSYLTKLDWLLFFVVLFLSFWGLAVIYSIALGQGAIQNGSIWSSLLMRKQIIALMAGLVLFFVFSLVDYRLFYIYNRSLFVGMALILILVIFIGSDIRGTKGWFEIFGFSFQPVEAAKIMVIAVLAKYFANQAKFLAQFRHIIISGSLVAVIAVLVLLQPDFGSTMILLSIWLGLVFVSGAPKKFLLLIFSGMLVVGVIGWLFLLKPYQKDRLAVFLNPELDAQGRGYNVTQAIIAIGSGQLFGKGLGFGSQSQLKFLPESHTDFIFAVIGEEMGLLSLIFFLALYGFFYYRLIKISRNSLDDFGYLFCLGVVISIFTQMFINIAMNIGLMPVTGLPLPFVSFGGSSLVMSFVMVGIAQNINIQSKLQGLR